MEIVINFDALFNVDNYTARSLAETEAKFAAQSEVTYDNVKAAREAHAIVFTAHMLVTMANVIRNDGKLGGSAVNDADIAKALKTNGKRISHARQVLQYGEPFSAVFTKQSGRYTMPNKDVVPHILNALKAETGGKSIETLHKSYGKKAVTAPVAPVAPVPPTDPVAPTDSSFNVDAYFMTGAQASHKRGVSRDAVLAAMVAAVEAVYGKAE